MNKINNYIKKSGFICLQKLINLTSILYLPLFFQANSSHSFMMQNKSIKSNKSKIVYDQPKSSKYFQKDPNTGLSKCKICWAVIQAKDNTGLLRLHLQQVHKMNAVKIYDPFVQPKIQKFNPTSIPIPILPNVPKFAQKSKQIRPTLPNYNSSNPRHNDWLNPFFQLVSDPSEEQIEQDKDQVKYMMHCTQFTDSIKYLEYNRYMDEQLNDIRQQLGQLPNLYKLPAMVTLMEKQQDNKNNQQIQEGTNQLNKDNKDNKDSKENKNSRYIKIFENKMQKNIKQLRQKYRVKEWLHEDSQLQKNIKQRKMQSQQKNKQNNQIIQILSQSNTNKQNTPQKQSSIHNKNNTIYSLPNIDCSKNQQQIYYQLVKYNDFNIIKIENENNQTAYVLCQNRMKQIYGIYGDSLCFLYIAVEGYVILIGFVEDWRLNMEVVGIIIVKIIQPNDVKTLILACLLQYFNVLKLPFPKSITIFSKFNPSLKQQFQKLLNLMQCENTVQVTQYNIINQQQNPQISEAQQINKKQQKFNTAYNNLKTRLSKIYNKYCKINGRLGRLQIQLLNIDQLYKYKSKDHGYDVKNKQLLKYRQFVGKKYKGFFNNYRNEQWNQLYKQLYNKLQYNLSSLTITNIISIIFCQLQLHHKSQKNKQLQNILKNTQKNKLNIPANIISPNLLNQLYQIQKLSQNIVILKHISPTYIQVFTVIPIQQKYNTVSCQQITQPQCSSCRVYKNTVLFDEIDNYWMCNCQKIVELGVPCCHLIKIISKIKGSLQYYIHQRWKPSEQYLQQLQQQMSQITGMGNMKQQQIQQIQQIQEIQEIQQMRQQIDAEDNIQIQANQQMQQNIEVLPQQNKDIIEIQQQKDVENELIQLKAEDHNPQKLLQ